MCRWCRRGFPSVDVRHRAVSRCPADINTTPSAGDRFFGLSFSDPVKSLPPVATGGRRINTDRQKPRGMFTAGVDWLRSTRLHPVSATFSCCMLYWVVIFKRSALWSTVCVLIASIRAQCPVYHSQCVILSGRESCRLSRPHSAHCSQTCCCNTPWHASSS